jgi:hypothetical protein
VERAVVLCTFDCWFAQFSDLQIFDLQSRINTKAQKRKEAKNRRSNGFAPLALCAFAISSPSLTRIDRKP